MVVFIKYIVNKNCRELTGILTVDSSKEDVKFHRTVNALLKLHENVINEFQCMKLINS